MGSEFRPTSIDFSPTPFHCGRSPKHMENRILDLIKQPLRHIWVGQNPPFDMPTVDLEHATAFRVSPSLHQSWDVVWVYERFISDYDSWKLALDECLRLFGESGLLVLRYKTRRVQFSNFGLKNFLFRRQGYAIEMVWEDGAATDSGFVATSVMRVRREGLQRYRPAPWTMAIVTQGTRVENVARFCKSVRDQDPDRQHEILVHGASHPSYEEYGVRYVEAASQAGGGGDAVTLGVKKNAIARAARHPNLLIAHDRYVLDEGFFDGFTRFGYDFDFCAVQQTYDDGEPYPAYCALNTTGLLWAPTVHCENYNVLHANQYINGGLMVFKTHALRACPFNDLLYWNQAEDVEVSRAFTDDGMPPRMNYLSSATTIGIPKAPAAQWRLDRHIDPFS
jgi:hypothetical protein